MLDPEHENLSIRKQCELLKINRATVYYKPMPTNDESALANEIRDIWVEMPFYGYRRITAELQRNGHNINHKRVRRMMLDMKLQALYPKPKTSIRNPDHKIYPYLLRNLEIVRPNQVWATDITYIKVKDGWMYLVAIIDVYSRFVLAWNLSNTLDRDFCLVTLDQALLIGKPEILNTDQGSQFTSNDWIKQVEGYGIKVSMDGRGRWADNVYIERFWRTLKHEHVFLHSYDSVSGLRESIARFIEMYNYRRLHQSLGYKTPAEVYVHNQKSGQFLHGKLYLKFV